MDLTAIDPIARAILYEGYLLYPYRANALKNCRPCAFGSLYPKPYCVANEETESWSMATDFLIAGSDETTLQGQIRFLQAVGDNSRDVLEREVMLVERRLGELARLPQRTGFSFTADESASLEGAVEVTTEWMRGSIYKARVRITNETPSGSSGLDRLTMLSTQAVLGLDNGRFISMIDPPADLRDLADGCRNRGLWPVLVGNRDRNDMILAAPVILYDFPQVAPESPGNHFDGTEIDEILTLRILTLTESEKLAMQGDERTRLLLERTEKLSNAERAALHGAIRIPDVQPGDRVRLQPSGRADIFDLALTAKLATVISVEQDLEGQVYFSVTVDDDPGQDLGRDGKPGHRFFFRRDELEPVSEEA